MKRCESRKREEEVEGRKKKLYWFFSNSHYKSCVAGQGQPTGLKRRDILWKGAARHGKALWPPAQRDVVSGGHQSRDSA